MGHRTWKQWVWFMPFDTGPGHLRIQKFTTIRLKALLWLVEQPVKKQPMAASSTGFLT
jgi:hypothetical protein